MRFLMQLLALALCLGLFSQVDGHGHPAHDCHCHHVCCPSFVVPGDFSVPAEEAAQQTARINSAWSAPFPKLSCRANKLKNIILKMGGSVVDKFRDTALSATVGIWGVLPDFASNPDYCMFSKLVNATVLLETDKAAGCRTLFSGLDDVSPVAADRLKLITNDALVNSGCAPRPTTPQPARQPTCFAKGAVCKVRELIKLKGWEYPCEFTKAIRRLYCSKKPIDKMIAVITAASLAPGYSQVIDQIDQKTIHQLFYLQTFGPIDPCCCHKFKEALEAVAPAAQSSAQNSAALARQQYPECACYIN